MAKKHKHLTLRGKTYGIRVPVPKNIQDVIGKKEVTRSLGTQDLSQANKLYPDKLSEVFKAFEFAQGEIENAKPALLIGFDPLASVRIWFNDKHAAITNTSKGQFSNKADLELHKQNLKSDMVELTSGDAERGLYAIQPSANKILLKQGYQPIQHTSFANVDTSDPKYDRFLEFLQSAQIELIEFELERLGEKIVRTPNGNIFWPNLISSQLSTKAGTLLSDLISEYMTVKGSYGKGKTIGDKYAAFRYLTELVGEGFLVENLNRTHFLGLRAILKAFPKNAEKLKLLKDKTLQQKSDYAQKHGLELMSRQNANKIISRLKSLMEYAVSTAVITQNPCKEVKFHISHADKAANIRKPFSYEQLQKLFTSEAFNKTYPLGAAMFWVPIIAVFHGFRMEEILILTMKEIKHDENLDVWYFDLTNFTTDDLKNSNALRRVPFNPILKKLGFDNFLSLCENNKGQRLFPELKKASGVDPTYRKLFSPKFTRYSKKVGVHTKHTVFHSFRRNFSIACSDAEIPTDYENALSGWTLVGGQGGTYKKPQDLSLNKLAEMMLKIEYPKLDLTHLYE